MARIGLWIDDPPSHVRKASYWKEVKRHGIQVAAIMLESAGPGLDSKYTVEDLKKIREYAVEKHDIELVLTLWPQPTKQYLDELEEKLPGYVVASGCSAVEVDLEGNWRKSKDVKGFANLDKAGDRLVEILKAVRDKYDVRIEVTTFPGHPENTKRADVAPHADRLLPQAYSVRNRDVGLIEWDGKYGPGSMQRWTLDLARTVPGEQKLSCGLAAYDQVWPGKTGQEAMQVAYDAAVAYGVEEVRYWSSKWVLGVRKNGYASKFLLSLKKGTS